MIASSWRVEKLEDAVNGIDYVGGGHTKGLKDRVAVLERQVALLLDYLNVYEETLPRVVRLKKRAKA